MRRISVFLVAFALGALPACEPHDADGHSHDHDTGGDEVPEPYAGKTNPLDGDAEAQAAGVELYMANCEGCHGPEGVGDGPDAAQLDPAPPDFHDHTLGHDDDYLLWRISDGGNGDPVTSDMPGWGADLSEEQIWQIVASMREL